VNNRIFRNVEMELSKGIFGIYYSTSSTYYSILLLIRRKLV